MNKVIIKNSDSDSMNATELVKYIKKNNKGISLTSKDLLSFLKYFQFIDCCKNDSSINEGYLPKEKYLKNHILQYDICEIYDKNLLYKKNYTIKITKKGQNYFMPFIQRLINLKEMVNKIKKQK